MQNLAMHAGASLDRMRKSVAKIEQGAIAGFVLVPRHNGGFSSDGAADRFCKQQRLASAQGDGVLLDPFEKLGVVDQTIFDDFS